VINPSDNTQHSRPRQTCPSWDSNPRSQQASGRRPTLQNSRPLGPAIYTSVRNNIPHYWRISKYVCLDFRHVCEIAKSDYLLHVCLSAWNNSAPTGRIFMKFYNCVFFRKSVKEFHVALKFEKNNWALHTKTDIQCWSYIAQFVLERETFHTKAAEKIKTHILCSITFFFSKIVPFTWCGKIV